MLRFIGYLAAITVIVFFLLARTQMILDKLDDFEIPSSQCNVVINNGNSDD